jgi:hypothetical protein
VVLLRKSFPQKTNLQPAAELNVTKGKKFKGFRFGSIAKAKAVFFEELVFLGFLLRRVWFS